MALSVGQVNNPTLNGVVSGGSGPLALGTNNGGLQPGGGQAGTQQLNGLHLATAPGGAPAPGAVVPSTQAPSAPGGLGGSSLNQPEYLQGIQQEYGNSITAAQQQLAGLNGYLPTEQNDVGNTANASIAQANQTAHDTMGQLQQQGSNTQSQQRLSLAELADQIHGQNQGLMNQLGASGAGFSSAAMTGQQALQHAQNTQAANVNSQANANLSNIGQEEGTTKDTLTTALGSIQAWKQTQLDSILNNYQNTAAQLSAAMGQAQGEEKARLAEFGQTLQASAATALSNLQATTNQAVSNTQNQLHAASTAQAPATQFATYKAPTDISYDQSSPFSGNAQSAGNATSTAAPTMPTGGSLAALTGQLQNQNQSALA